jgi:hypothetical protein
MVDQVSYILKHIQTDLLRRYLGNDEARSRGAHRHEPSARYARDVDYRGCCDGYGIGHEVLSEEVGGRGDLRLGLRGRQEPMKKRCVAIFV